MNTSSVNNETVSKPAGNTFEPLHVGFIVFYAKREETNSKLDIEEGGHQQEVVILTSEKIISVCEWLNDLSSFSSFNRQSSNVQENSCVLLCFHKTSIVEESPTYQSHPIFGPKPFRLIYLFEMRLIICDVTDTATHNLTAFHNIKWPWRDAIFSAACRPSSLPIWILKMHAMQCGSLYNCRSLDLQSQGVAKCRLVSRREASVWRSSCTPEGKTRTPHHV